MQPEIFKAQIERLKTQWKNSYGEERVKAIWSRVKNEDAEVFEGVVTQYLLDGKYAPLGNQIVDACRELKAASNRGIKEYGGSGMVAVLSRAAANAPPATKEYARACVQLLCDKISGKLTKKQFEEGLGFLEKAKTYRAGCAKCADFGYQFVGEHKHLYRCTCAIGVQMPQSAIGPKRGTQPGEQVLVPQYYGK